MTHQYSKQAEKFLDKQSDKTFDRIVAAIDKLPEGDVVKLSGYKELYRLRVGDFRILYKIMCGEILIDKIDNRGQAYKN